MERKFLRLLLIFASIAYINSSCDKKINEPILVTEGDINYYIYPEDNAEAVNWYDAKNICENLVAYNYDDWYLPSIDELEMLENKHTKFDSFQQYWSSSEISESKAHYMITLVSIGETADLNKKEISIVRRVGPVTKGGSMKCRCIRKESK